jgi:WD40 repeat protein
VGQLRRLFPPDGRFILTPSEDGTAHLWDVPSGRELRRFEGHIGWSNSACFSADGRFVLTTGHDGTARLWDAASGRELRVFLEHGLQSAVFSPHGDSVLTASQDMTARLWDAASGRELHRFVGHTDWVESAAFSPDGRFVLTASDDRTARLWDVASGRELRRFEGHTRQVYSAVFSPDPAGRLILTASRDNTTRLWDMASGRELRRFEGHGDWVQSAVFSLDGQLILTSGQDKTARLWNVASGRELRRFEGHTAWVNSAVFSPPDGRFVLTAAGDHTVRLWSVETGKEVAQFVSFTDGTWVVVRPDGRFDTNNLEEIKGLHWIMPDDPLHALPLEIFMRDYYEPRLLPRVLAEQPTFKPVRPLAELNRVQPEVRIAGVRRGESADIALVDVEVAEKEDRSQKNGKTKTAVYDLRLFRDGQLVGQWPEAGSEIGGQEDLEAWRRSSKVPMAAGATKGVHTFKVRLASRDQGQAVRFTAYAFNEDRVKSETAGHDTYKVPADIAPRTPRAYVVTVGVNSTDSPRFRPLSFAVKDAQVLATSLAQIPGYDVVPVSLLSDIRSKAALNQATKANLRTVLEVLAGKPADRSRLQGIANVEKLAKATPDDLVIVAFSGHGHTERDGRFYLVPADSGREDRITAAALTKFVSSEELSLWLREVDAGEMALVIDACHSAASVEVPGFKPGPMGDRGLGQLAYDKGMRILAATQADDVALESEKLEQGLLSYALVRDGLGLKEGTARRADLNGDGRVMLQEWLEYGVKRVPDLYDEVKSGKLRLAGRDTAADPAFVTQIVRNAQTPSLFDFHRQPDRVVLVGR